MKELINYGKKMVAAGLVDSHFGNVSKRVGDKMLISTTGSMLDGLEGQIVEVPIYEESLIDMVASVSIKTHRLIYQRTSALAVLHGHPKFCVVISLLYGDEGVIKPEDVESEYMLHEIPIVEGQEGTDELAENVSNAMITHKAVIARGHGAFTQGATVNEAFVYLSSVERACMVKYFTDIGRWLKETGGKK